MTKQTFIKLLLLSLLSGFGTSAIAQSPNSDPLKAFTACKVSGELKIKEITRRGTRNDFREVTIGNDKKKVSVIDGYRVMFAYPDVLYYYANVKIEQSSPESYEKDKQIIVDQLKYYTTTKDTTPLIFSDKQTLNGFEHYGIDRDKIDVGGTIGTHVLFYGAKQLVVTIYFLNQSKAVFGNHRRFESIKEYQELRDKFLTEYSTCLSNVAENKKTDGGR